MKIGIYRYKISIYIERSSTWLGAMTIESPVWISIYLYISLLLYLSIYLPAYLSIKIDINIYKSGAAPGSAR